MRGMFVSMGVLALTVFSVAACSDSEVESDRGEELGTSQAALHGSGTQYAAVYNFSLERQRFSIASLERNQSHAKIGVSTGGLEPGDAYTLWFCGWNNPAACSFGNPPEGELCAAGDFEFMGGDPVTDDFCVWSGAGAVANNFGRASFRSVTVPGANEGENLFGTDYTAINGAEIHMIVRHHDDALTGTDLRDQLTMFNGACPATGCVDVLFAVFPAR